MEFSNTWFVYRVQFVGGTHNASESTVTPKRRPCRRKPFRSCRLSTFFLILVFAFTFDSHMFWFWGTCSKIPETFRARKAIFSSSVSQNEEVYTAETSCMKRTSVHINVGAPTLIREKKKAL